MMGSEETRGRSHSRELERLQNMVRKLGIDRDSKNNYDGGFNEYEDSTGSPTNGYLNGSLENNLNASFDDGDSANGDVLNRSLDEFNELDLDEALDHIKEDSWLCESPMKSVVSPKSPYVWLKEDVNTPELKRVRTSLITKLDYIGIQNRDEQLEKIINQHGMGEEHPGRLYHSASFASMVSLDWDYDLDGPRNTGHPGGPRHAWSDNRRKISTEYDGTYTRPSHRRSSGERGHADLDDPYSRHARKASYELDDPYSYRGRFEMEDPYGVQEDLDPLNLEFEASPPVIRRPLVATNHTITKRSIRQSSPVRSRSPEKYSDFADDDLIAKPRGNVRPRKSKYTFERSDSKDSDNSYPQTGSLLQSDQSDLDSLGEQPSPRPSRSSSRGSVLSDDLGPVRPRGVKADSGSPTVANLPSGTGQVKKRSSKPQKQQQQPQIRPRGTATASTPEKGDPSLKVKLPQSSSGGPVIRRRGAGPPSTNGSSPRAGSPLGADSSSQESLTMTSTPRGGQSTPKTRQSLPQPRRSGPGTGIPTPRGGIPKVRRSASPDVTARRSNSPDAKPRPRRGPAATSQDPAESWQSGLY